MNRRDKKVLTDNPPQPQPNRLRALGPVLVFLFAACQSIPKHSLNRTGQGDQPDYSSNLHCVVRKSNNQHSRVLWSSYCGHHFAYDITMADQPEGEAVVFASQVVLEKKLKASTNWLGKDPL